LVKLEVSQCNANRLNLASKKFLLIVAALYSGALVTVGGIYWYTKHTLEKIQPVPDDWTFKQKLLGLAGANHHEEERYGIVLKYYEELVNELVLNEDGSVKDIDKKSPTWLAGYADIVLRLGLSQEKMGHCEDAKQALESGCSIPYGQKSLKAKGELQLGLYEKESGNFREAEKLIKKSIGYLLSKDQITDNSGFVIVNKTTLLTDEQVTPLMELAKLYVAQKQLKEALNLFLSIQRGIKEHVRSMGDSKHLADSKCLEPTVMSYVSEILWALNNKRDAIIWAEGSYHEANSKSRGRIECGLCAQMAANNISKMYKHFKMMDQSEEFKKLSENQYIAPINSRKKEPFWTKVI
jgi:tetratricopeptide (TPR) repeat protein